MPDKSMVVFWSEESGFESTIAVGTGTAGRGLGGLSVDISSGLILPTTGMIALFHFGGLIDPLPTRDRRVSGMNLGDPIVSGYMMALDETYRTRVTKQIDAQIQMNQNMDLSRMSGPI